MLTTLKKRRELLQRACGKIYLFVSIHVYTKLNYSNDAFYSVIIDCFFAFTISVVFSVIIMMSICCFCFFCHISLFFAGLPQAQSDQKRKEINKCLDQNGSEQVKIYNFCEAATDSYIVTVYMFVCVL